MSELPRYAMRKRNFLQTRNKSRERYNESSSFLNYLMKRLSFRASRGGGGGGGRIHTRIKSRERSNESSSFSNNLMKRQSFRASRGRGGETPPPCTQPPWERALRAHYHPPKMKSWLRAWGGGVTCHTLLPLGCFDPLPKIFWHLSSPPTTDTNRHPW